MTRVAFATLGCRVNQADTQEIQERLEAAGCRTVPFEAPADVVVINTCTVTSRAELSDRQLIRRAARTHPNARIVVTGCWAQMAPEAVAALPGVDLVVGTHERHRVAEWVRTFPGSCPDVDPQAAARRVRHHVQFPSLSHAASAVGWPRRDPAEPHHWSDPHDFPVPAAFPAPDVDPAGAPGQSGPRVPTTAADRSVEASGKAPTPTVGLEQADRAVTGPVPRTRAAARTRAFLKVQDGCQHRCAFCIVPFARGPSRSRDPKLIADRVAELVEAGHPEVVLTGVDMGHYGGDLVPRTTLARLLHDLAGVPGLRWIRLSSLLPAYFTAELTEAVTTIPVIAPHLHLPLQSGSDRVLRSMRRPYTTGLYRRIVDKLVESIPVLGLGTDLIAGFPGERQEDFAETRDLVTALPFSYLHVFPYSDRTRTEAAGRPDHLPARETSERSRQLRRLGQAKNLAFRQRLVDGIEEVLVLATRERETGRLVGLTGNFVEVTFAGPDALIGRLARVRVTEAHAHRTEGAWSA